MIVVRCALYLASVLLPHEHRSILKGTVPQTSSLTLNDSACQHRHSVSGELADAACGLRPRGRHVSPAVSPECRSVTVQRNGAEPEEHERAGLPAAVLSQTE
jgi:hypothetical protein